MDALTLIIIGAGSWWLGWSLGKERGMLEEGRWWAERERKRWRR